MRRDTEPGGEGKGTFPAALPKRPMGLSTLKQTAPAALTCLPFPHVRLLTADMQNNANEVIKMLITLKELTAH